MILPENTRSAFISYGAQVKMYTLHVIYDEIKVVNNVSKRKTLSFYVKNLSNKKDKAIEKAVEYAAEHGIEFVSTTNANQELGEITRQNLEQAHRAAQEQREKEEQERIENSEVMVITFEEQFQSSHFSFGNHEGKSFADVLVDDPQYVKFILSNSNEELPMQYPQTINQVCVNSLHAYVEKNGYPKTPEEDSKFVGEIKDKIEVKVVVRKKMSFDSYYGTKTMYQFMDENNNVYVTFYSGHSWKLDVGEEASIKGTVDKHQVYDNVNQTLLKRVKVL